MRRYPKNEGNYFEIPVLIENQFLFRKEISKLAEILNVVQFSKDNLLFMVETLDAKHNDLVCEIGFKYFLHEKGIEIYETALKNIKEICENQLKEKCDNCKGFCQFDCIKKLKAIGFKFDDKGNLI